MRSQPHIWGKAWGIRHSKLVENQTNDQNTAKHNLKYTNTRQNGEKNPTEKIPAGICELMYEELEYFFQSDLPWDVTMQKIWWLASCVLVLVEAHGSFHPPKLVGVVL